MILIIGGGNVGIEAAKYFEDRDFLIVDVNENCVAAKRYPEKFVKGSAKDLIDLVEKFEVSYIIPAAPVHVAAEALTALEFRPDLSTSEHFLSALPSRTIFSFSDGSAVVTYNREGRCLPGCSEPEVCPVTGLRKPCPMFRLIEFCIPEAFVLVSEQIKPGLGGFRGEKFRELVELAKNARSVIVATACGCHGVVTAMRR
ncbi:MAG: hypothetical protein ABWW66_05780 [Archaeoglobaceae archaeon]